MGFAVQQPEIRLSVADASGSVGHFGLHVRAGATVAQARAALGQLRQLAPTECTPIAGRVRVEAIEEEPADGAGDAHRCGVFVFETASAGQLAIVSVPGLVVGLVDPADPMLVDRANPAVVAFIDALINGEWCNPWGYKLTKCVVALVEIRKTK